MLGLLWLRPRSIDELKGFEDVVEAFVNAGVAVKEGDMIVLNKDRLHPVMRRAAEAIAKVLVEEGDRVLVKPKKV